MNASSGSPCQLPPISWNLFPPHNNNRTSETCLGDMTIRWPFLEISYSNPETPKPHNEPTIPHNVVRLLVTLNGDVITPILFALQMLVTGVFSPAPKKVVEFVSPYQAMPMFTTDFHHLSVPLKRLELSNISLARWSNASNSDGCA